MKVVRFLLCNCFIITLLLLLSINIVNAEDEIIVKYEENQILFEDQAPVIKDGRTLVPMRKIFETLGMTVSWDETTQKITGEKENKKIELFINSNTARIDNTYKTVEVPPQIINGRTMVPIRFISEELGLDVKWEENTKIISIKDKDKEIGELYYDSGKIKYRGVLTNNIPNGNGIFYNENGFKQLEGNFKNGYPLGTYKVYSETGHLLLEGISTDGDENVAGQGNIYSADGRIVYEGKVKNFLSNGYGKAFDSNGLVFYEGNWKDGKMDGEGKAYDKGKLLFSGVWKDGEFVGTSSSNTNNNDQEDKNGWDNLESLYSEANSNDKLKKIKNIEEFESYLNKTYDKIKTPMGDINLSHSVDKNQHSILPYDYWIQTDWDSLDDEFLKGFSPFNLQYSIEYSDKEKEKTKELLRETQMKIAVDAITVFPDKKITGGYYSGFYKYPYSKVGYETIEFLTWVNYERSILGDYNNSELSKLKWDSSGDDYDFTK